MALISKWVQTTAIIESLDETLAYDAAFTEKQYRPVVKYNVDEFVYESVLYFYEMDRRQDGGLQCDVFRCDENLTYIETLAFVNYDLYRVLDDGQMVFIR